MAWASTGLAGLDKLLRNLKKGDNVVWQVDGIDGCCHFLADVSPEDDEYADVILVCDVESEQLQIMSDVISQRVVCFFA